jgi:hypothetical protein
VREIQLTDEAGITQAMEKLKEQQAEANMDPQDVLKENTKSLISLRDSLDTLTSKEALLKLGAGAFDTQPVQDVIQGLKESVVKVKETLSDTATEIGKKFEDGKIDDEEVKDLINKTTDSLAKNAIDFAEKVGISKTAVESFVTALENAAKTIADIDINNKPGTETQDTAPGTKTMEGKDPEEQDFILRPNQEPISFSKDDIIIGGTDLFGTKSQSNYEPANNLPSIIEKQSSVLDNLYNNVSTSVQKIEQTMAVKDINVNVSGTISVTDRNGNMVDLLRNSDVQNQIVMIVEDAFKRGKDQFV